MPAESGERLSVIDCLVPLLFGFRITSAVDFEGDAVRIAVRYTPLHTVSGLEVGLPENAGRSLDRVNALTVEVALPARLVDNTGTIDLS